MLVSRILRTHRQLPCRSPASSSTTMSLPWVASSVPSSVSKFAIRAHGSTTNFALLSGPLQYDSARPSKQLADSNFLLFASATEQSRGTRRNEARPGCDKFPHKHFFFGCVSCKQDAGGPRTLKHARRAESNTIPFSPVENHIKLAASSQFSPSHGVI